MKIVLIQAVVDEPSYFVIKEVDIEQKSISVDTIGRFPDNISARRAMHNEIFTDRLLSCVYESRTVEVWL